MSVANNGVRVLTSGELDLVTGARTVIEFGMGPVAFQFDMDPESGGVTIWNGRPGSGLKHEPIHGRGPRPA